MSQLGRGKLGVVSTSSILGPRLGGEGAAPIFAARYRLRIKRFEEGSRIIAVLSQETGH